MSISTGSDEAPVFGGWTSTRLRKPSSRMTSRSFRSASSARGVAFLTTRSSDASCSQMILLALAKHRQQRRSPISLRTCSSGFQVFPVGRCASAVLAMFLCLSVCLSITRRYCTETDERIEVVYDTDDTLGLSYIVLEWNWGISIYEGTSRWNFVPNSEFIL